MRRLLAFCLVMFMTALLVACDDSETVNKIDEQSVNISSDTQSNTDIENIVSREEICGVYETVVNEDIIFIFRQDSILRGWKTSPEKAVAIFQIHEWKIRGDQLVICEATGMGNAVFEIAKENETVKLKFLMFEEGDGGALNSLPELLSVLTKTGTE